MVQPNRFRVWKMAQTISLGEHWNDFIKDRVGKNGRYAAAIELVRDSLKLLEEKEADSKLEGLRAALVKGEESGCSGELDMEDIKKEARQEAGLS
jgi:antitoxin ParD1/3/4